MAKPAGAVCNLDCRVLFLPEEADSLSAEHAKDAG